MPTQPSYARVYNVIKSDILNDVYSAGDFLSPEPELCKRFGVSRITVRHAIDLLKQDGYVTVRQGHGTIIQDHNSVTHKLNTVNSISETLTKLGYRVSTKEMTIDIIPAEKKIARDLNLQEGVEIVRIERVQLADDKPVAIMKNYLIKEMVPGIKDYVNKFAHLYHFLEDRYGIIIDSAKDRITASNANKNESQMLQIPENTALINYWRTCFANDRPIIVDHVNILGGFYWYEFDVVGRPNRVN